MHKQFHDFSEKVGWLTGRPIPFESAERGESDEQEILSAVGGLTKLHLFRGTATVSLLYIYCSSISLRLNKFDPCNLVCVNDYNVKSSFKTPNK